MFAVINFDTECFTLIVPIIMQALRQENVYLYKFSNEYFRNKDSLFDYYEVINYHRKGIISNKARTALR